MEMIDKFLRKYDDCMDVGIEKEEEEKKRLDDLPQTTQQVTEGRNKTHSPSQKS